MKLIKIAKDNTKESFYSFLKSQNIMIDFFHGTSTENWKKIQEDGFMSPPSFRGKEEEEERFLIRTDGFTPEEAVTMGGLDKIYFTKSMEIAESYAFRDSDTGFNNSPFVLFVSIPLCELDEIKGHIANEFIYNETGSDKYCGEVMDRSDLDNQEKLNLILKYIDSDKELEWTVKGNLSIFDVDGIKRIKTEDDIEKENHWSSPKNFTSDDWDMWPSIEDDKLKFHPEIVKKTVSGYIQYLKSESKFIDFEDLYIFNWDEAKIGELYANMIIEAKIDALISLIKNRYDIPDQGSIHPRLENHPRYKKHISSLISQSFSWYDIYTTSQKK